MSRWLRYPHTKTRGSAEAKAVPGRKPRPMPQRIDAAPEAIARAIMARPPKKNWRYLERGKEPAS